MLNNLLTLYINTAFHKLRPWLNRYFLPHLFHLIIIQTYRLYLTISLLVTGDPVSARPWAQEPTRQGSQLSAGARRLLQKPDHSNSQQGAVIKASAEACTRGTLTSSKPQTELTGERSRPCWETATLVLKIILSGLYRALHCTCSSGS